MSFFRLDLGVQHNNYVPKMICIGLVLQGLAGCSDNSPEIPAVGEYFPMSALKQLQKVSDGVIDINNKTLLINFWATWCPPCRTEMPDLQQLSDGLDQDRYAVIGVSVDEDINLVREFLLQHHIRFPIFQDDNFKFASELLKIETYPDTFIVSPQGIITKRINGTIRWNDNDIENIFESNTPNDAITQGYPLKG